MQRPSSRLAGALAAVAALGLAVPATASAHALIDTYTFPVPLSLFLLGGGVVVAATFAIASLGPTAGPAPAGAALGPPGLLRPWRALGPTGRRIAAFVLEGVTLLLWGLALASLLLSDEAPFGITWVWVAFWVGLGTVSGLIGNAFAWLSPWTILARRVVGPLAADRELRGLLPYPAWVGRWPAVGLLLVWSWFELVWAPAKEPLVLGLILVGYTCINAVGTLVYGLDAWNGNVEVFSVLALTLARFAPVELRALPDEPCEACQIATDEPPPPLRVDCPECYRRAAPEQRALPLRIWGTGLLRGPGIPPGGLAFVVAALGTVVFDGMLGTSWWRHVQAWTETWSEFLRVTLVPTIGLLACVSALGLLVTIASLTLGGGDGAMARARRYAPALIPVAAVYFAAHYAALLWTYAPRIISGVSDPLDRGWNLFGTAHAPIGDWIGFPSARAIWYLSLTLIIGGHVAGVLTAHRLALTEGGADRVGRFRAQIPMAVLMVAYTMLGLWVLAAQVSSQ